MMVACRGAVPASVEAQGEAGQTGAGRAGSSTSLSAGDAGNSSKTARPASELKTLKLIHPTSEKPIVGAQIEATAENLPPGRTVDLLWETVQGGWVVENGYRFRGKHYTDRTKVLGRAQIGGDGRLAARFAIPEDF